MDADGDIEDNEHRYTSSVWKHFQIVNKKDWISKCNYCERLIKFQSSTSNLKKHLTRKHSDLLGIVSEDEEEGTAEEVTYLESDLEEEDEKQQSDQEQEVPFDKRKILRNGAWEYFEVLDEENKTATCTICREQFSYRTTSTNLAKHLRRRHCIEFEKVTDDDYHVKKESDGGGDDDDEDSDDKNGRDKRRSKTSAAWEYFTVKDPIRRIATCKICESQCSYLTSVSNLMKHVRCKHGVGSSMRMDDEAIYDVDDIDLSKPEGKNHNRSSVWLYFKCIDNTAKVSVCLICKKQLSHLTSITNLKKHLHRKHPGIQLDSTVNDKKMLIASDGQLYEIEESKHDTEPDDDHDQTEPLEMNAIYLDDYEAGTSERKRKRRSSSANKAKRTYLDETTGVTETLSSDEEITFQKRYVRKKHDSLDQFGKYLVSLLKQLPKELSNQLQADFVKQVMTAQLSYESQKVIVTPSNGYAITITESRAEDEMNDAVPSEVGDENS